MARTRIRTIKPELWQDARVCDLSRDARLLLVGLVTMADDEGRLLSAPAVVLGHIFPLDADAPRRLEAWLDEVEGSGMVLRYEIDGKPYVAFRHWRRHQKINRPTPSTLPPSPDEGVNAANAVPGSRQAQGADSEFSGSSHGSLTESSVSDHGGLTSPRIGARSDPIRSGSPSSSITSESSVAASGDGATKHAEDLARRRERQQEILHAWNTYAGCRREVLGNRSQPKLDAKRKALIGRRLEEWPLQDVLDAVKGWRHFPHNRGENDRNQPYCDIELVLRDATHIERFRDAERAAGSGPGTTGALHTADGFIAATQPRRDRERALLGDVLESA